MRKYSWVGGKVCGWGGAVMRPCGGRRRGEGGICVDGWKPVVPEAYTCWASLPWPTPGLGAPLRMIREGGGGCLGGLRGHFFVRAFVFRF